MSETKFTMMQVEQAAQWLSGARVLGSASGQVVRVHTDSRTLEPGDLFVAIRGERFDANDFLSEALAKGATAVVCHARSGNVELSRDLTLIEVPDTRKALIELATAWRRQMSLPVIAVTGSNGKTTVTQMLAAILRVHAPNGASLATSGNLNNDIGVPLTVLRLREAHRIAVIEMGMNHPGEISTLAAVAQPTVVLVNNAQREHLEFMHTVEAVAKENGRAIEALGNLGVAVFPADDGYTPLWERIANGRSVCQFAMTGTPDAGALVCLHANWHDGAWLVEAQGLGVKLRYRLAIAGRHNVKNSLAAAACALAAGVSASAVEEGLQNFVPVKGRSRALEVAVSGHLITLVDDSYNANPDSVHAAIEVLADLPGPHLLVLGDMGEVGRQGAQLHAEAGRYVQARGISHFLAMGPLSRAAVDVCAGARHFETIESMIESVLALLPQVRSVLVKGSRFMRMERVVDAIYQHNVQHKEAPDAR